MQVRQHTRMHSVDALSALCFKQIDRGFTARLYVVTIVSISNILLRLMMNYMNVVQ